MKPIKVNPYLLIFTAGAIVGEILIILAFLLAPHAHAYTPEDVLAAVNSDRPTPLVINPELSKAAQDKANQLISCGCFAHTTACSCNYYYFIFYIIFHNSVFSIFR